MTNKVYIIYPKLPIGKKISSLSGHIQANVLKALTDGMKLAETTSQTKYLTGPRPDRLGVVTGLLRSSVKSAVMKGGEGGAFATGFLRAGSAGKGVEYANIHEYGGKTRAHLISAKNVRNLKFFWKKMGIWFLGPRVNHPGSVVPARPYLRPAMDETFPIVENLIQAAIDKAYRDS